MKFVVTGASGFIGQQVVQNFRERGADLLLVGREPAKLRQFFPDLECCHYSELPARAVGYDAVLHLAVMNNKTYNPLGVYLDANVDFGVAVVEAAKRAGIPHFVNVSTTHALDPNRRSNYAISKALAAEAIDAVAGIRVTTVYLPAVVGPRMPGRFAAVFGLPALLRRPLLLIAAAWVPIIDGQQSLDVLWEALTNSESPRRMIATLGQVDNTAYSLAKRAIDIVGALFILVGLFWLLAIIWGAIRLQTGGPGLFRQHRVGKDGKTFTCYKFRTMFAGAPNVGTHEATIEMVTPIGRFLRRTKLDELPQAINIIRNEMAFVGPRPSLTTQAALIAARTRRGVLAIKPGITGLAQVNAIDMSQPETLAEWDERYLKLRSLKFDLEILLGTALGRGSGDAIGQQKQSRGPKSQ